MYNLGQFGFWKHWNKKFFHILVGVVRIILLDHFQAQSDFCILISLFSFELSSQASQQLMGGYQALSLPLLCYQVLHSFFLQWNCEKEGALWFTHFHNGFVSLWGLVWLQSCLAHVADVKRLFREHAKRTWHTFFISFKSVLIFWQSKPRFLLADTLVIVLIYG